MSRALPAVMYRNPEEAFSCLEAKGVYQEKGCAACASYDPKRKGLLCKKNITPGRYWCRGFREA